MARFSPSVRSADSSLTEGAKYDSEVTIYERPAARLKKLVPLVESLGAEKAAADPHRQRFHIQPMVGWLNDGAAVLSTRYYPAGVPTLRTANLDAVVYPLNL